MVVGTQALGEPRYPTLRGIMGARSKTITTWSLADLGLDAAAVGGESATVRVRSVRFPEARGSVRVIREPAAVAAAQIVDFLVERRAI
jgi:electron transfer flavoprotein beta subunit